MDDADAAEEADEGALIRNRFGKWDFVRKEEEEEEEARERRERWATAVYETKVAERGRADAQVALMRKFEEDCDNDSADVAAMGFRGCLLREEQAAADARQRQKTRRREEKLWDIAKAVVASQRAGRCDMEKKRKSGGADTNRRCIR